MFEHDPDMTISVGARRLKLREHQVRHSFHRLTSSKRAWRMHFINAMALGYHDIAVFGSFKSGNTQVRKKDLEVLVRDPRVTYVGKVLGDFDLVAVFYCEDTAEFYELLREHPVFGMFSCYAVAVRIRYLKFGRKYLTDHAPRVFALEHSRMRPTVDDLDREILCHLASESVGSVRDLARHLGQPFSTIDRRMTKLHENGIIVGSFLEASAAELGVEVYRLLIELPSSTKKTIEKIIDFAARHPQMTHLAESFGSWDIEISVECAGAQELHSVINALRGLPEMQFAAVKILLEVSDLKWNFFPFESSKEHKQKCVAEIRSNQRRLSS